MSMSRMINYVDNHKKGKCLKNLGTSINNLYDVVSECSQCTIKHFIVFYACKYVYNTYHVVKL